MTTAHQFAFVNQSLQSGFNLRNRKKNFTCRMTTDNPYSISPGVMGNSCNIDFYSVLKMPLHHGIGKCFRSTSQCGVRWYECQTKLPMKLGETVHFGAPNKPLQLFGRKWLNPLSGDQNRHEGVARSTASAIKIGHRDVVIFC